MNTQLFVEDAISISPKQILENQIISDHSKAEINYWLDNDANPAIAYVSVQGREPQAYNLDWSTITFGERAYFECQCGAKANKLFLPANGKEFKCRQCHNLQYQLTSFNRNSVGGRALYKMNRLQKLSEARADMGRILYRGEYTRRFERFLGLCDKAGLNDVVAGANNLMALLKG